METQLLSGSATQVKMNPSIRPILIKLDFDISKKSPFPPEDVTSWREGGGRNLQPSSLTLGLPAEAEGKLTALGDSGTPPATSHPSSTTGTTSSSIATAPSPVPDPKEPSLRPAQPIRRTTVPTALQYQLHHTSTAVYHDMLPAFVSTD